MKDIYMSLTGFMFLLQPVLMLSLNSDNSTNIRSTLPYRVQYGIDIEKYYYEILFHCYVSVFSHMLILASINLIYTSFIQHACGLFSVIGPIILLIWKDNRKYKCSLKVPFISKCNVKRFFYVWIISNLFLVSTSLIQCITI
ncbi:LOW QUALITY PROTEIN: odorant receptor 13a-like [Vespula squamosa]|uniref:Odorant receptor 13a-like n=1 Tax=Vespula squamosa TaxID=30214 RepID=A0ABD2B3J1_VESSQ